jgi:hypothetical protein
MSLQLSVVLIVTSDDAALNQASIAILRPSSFSHPVPQGQAQEDDFGMGFGSADDPEEKFACFLQENRKS